MNIYVGNFSYDVTEEDLVTHFANYGHVESAKIIKDKFTGTSRGFGFVEMPNKTEAQAAMDGLKEIGGRMITINEARPMEKRSGSGGRGGHGRQKSSGGYRRNSY